MDYGAFISDLCLVYKIKHSIYMMDKEKHDDNGNISVLVPKCKQVECLRHAVNEVDIIACLPTGYGKSFLYEMLPYIEAEFSKKLTSAVLVVSPLNAIIDDHLNRLGNRGVKVVQENVQHFVNPKCRYFLGHPESILDKGMHSGLLAAQHRMDWIVIDEAHCIQQWAKFRPAFEQLNKLRALFPKAKVLALTATATSSARDEICKTLVMKVNGSY